MPRLFTTIILGTTMLLSACTSPSLQHYNNTTPELDIKQYFDGPIQAWGIVQDWRGNVTRKFDIEMVGYWDGDSGRLEEDFVYDDGKTQRRVWTINKLSNNTYEGTAGDIKGKAQGHTNGNAVQWKYQMNLEVDGKTYLITFDDWMFLMKDGVLINRSYLKKFGITVAELTIFMKKK
jgi:Protein of unknown function (DUF3833)